VRSNRSLRRCAAGALVVAIAGGSSVLGGVANAAVPSGTFTVTPSTGSDATPVEGLTNGKCDAPGNPPDDAVDGFNAVVTGPGAFAADPAHGKPDGTIVVGTSNIGFSTTAPIHFILRASFHDLAQELGTTLQAGDYVITLRCINQFNGTVYQTFSQTLTFTGGPPATAYTVTNAQPVSPSPGMSPSPGASPSPTPSPTPKDSPTATPTTTSDNTTSTPAMSTTDAAVATTSSDPGSGTQPVASTGGLAKTGAPVALLFLGGLFLLATGLALVVWLRHPRRRRP
jgi:hypothetical protein